MDPESIAAADRLLLRCGARATALLHPNQEHPPTGVERGSSIECLRRDLAALAAAIPGWLRRSDNDLHASENSRGR